MYEHNKNVCFIVCFVMRANTNYMGTIARIICFYKVLYSRLFCEDKNCLLSILVSFQDLQSCVVNSAKEIEVRNKESYKTVQLREIKMNLNSRELIYMIWQLPIFYSKMFFCSVVLFICLKKHMSIFIHMSMIYTSE